MITRPRMNAKWLRAFLIEKRVKKPGAKWDLSDNALLLLAVFIFIRAEHHRDPPPPHAAVEAYAGATETRYLAEEVRERLEKLLAADALALTLWNERPDHDLSKPIQIERINGSISRLTAAINALGDLCPRLKSSVHWPPRTKWEHHAVDLARAFVRHVRECQPGYSIGISKAGPVVSFVWAVIPLITGENPSPGRVEQFLQEWAAAQYPHAEARPAEARFVRVQRPIQRPAQRPVRRRPVHRMANFRVGENGRSELPAPVGV